MLGITPILNKFPGTTALSVNVASSGSVDLVTARRFIQSSRIDFMTQARHKLS